jgi:hypothetical protein
LSDLENTISGNIERAVVLTNDRYPDQPKYLSNLSTSQHVRFERFEYLSDLENAISDVEKTVLLTDDQHPDRPTDLSNLGVTQRACASGTMP